MTTGAHASNLHSAWAALFARALARSGVTDVVLSPGSRSTPLALAFSRESSLTVTPVIDERSAAFFALGQSRVTGRPTVLVCTSGTAGAHYYPAVIEANQAQLPLVVVTADRPWELQDTAAPQTIDQTKLFGDHVRCSLELGLPEAAALAHVGRIAARCVSLALHPIAGPVHVNARFRKPLEPIDVQGREPWQDELDRWMERGAPRVFLPVSIPQDAAVDRIARACVESRRGIVVVGPTSGTKLSDPAMAARFRRALAAVATRFGFPIFAEATSQAKLGPELEGLLAGSFDAVLRTGFGENRPDLVIEVSSPPVSPAYAALAASPVRRIVIAEHGLPDPHGTASDVIMGDPIELLERLAQLSPPEAHEPDRSWLEGASRAGEDAERLAREASGEGLTEASIPRAIVSALPDGAVLAIGNSLPVRDLDTFGGPSQRAVTVLHQRGASGIDGLIAGACGTRSKVDPSHPIVLLLGDVSAQHDVGSLALAAESRAPLVIVVVQNRGGRIFEELPIANDPTLASELERLFVTPPRATEPAATVISGAARGFGVAYVAATDRAAFVGALHDALLSRRATVIEAFVSPHDGRARRSEHIASVRRVIEAGRGARR